MKFTQRLAYYLLGFLIGGLFLLFFFQGKTKGQDISYCYLPNCRVLKDLRNKPFHYSDVASEKLAQEWLDTIDIKNTLRYGDVDFKNSNVPMENGKYYIIEGKTINQKPIFVEVINYSEKVVLKDVLTQKP